MNHFGECQTDHFDSMSQKVKEFREKIELQFVSTIEELIEPWDVTAKRQLIAEREIQETFYRR